MKKNLTISLLFLLAAAVGCSTIKELGRSGDSSNTSVDNSTASADNTAIAKDDGTAATAGEFAPSSDPKADIEKLGQRFLEQKTFRAEMELNGKTSMKADLEFQAPDRFHMTNQLGSGQQTEMIMIGKQVYMSAGGRWIKIPASIGQTTTKDMREMFSKEGMKWFRDVKYTGEAKVDGKDAYIYDYTGKPDGMSEYTSRIWIGKADGMPLKINAEYKSGEMKSMSIVYDYSTPVSIEPPIK